VTAAFVATVAARPDEVALRWRVPGGWSSWTWRDYAERAARVAAGLGDLGVEKGDRIVLMTRNRPEFHAADMAALLVGAVPVSVYESSSAEQVRCVAGHAEAVVAVIEPEFLDRVLDARATLGGLRHVVVISDPGAALAPGLVSFSTLPRRTSRPRRQGHGRRTWRRSSTRRARRARPRPSRSPMATCRGPFVASCRPSATTCPGGG
jgi:long-chain acyl-CoA synthetase